MVDGLPGARRRKRRAAAWIVAAFIASSAFAQSASEPPNFIGFQAGRAIIAPSVTVGYAYDSNVLQRPPESQPPPSGDAILSLEPAVLLTVPFSNSLFQFGDVLVYRDYSTTQQTQGKTANDAKADLLLNFASRDQLEIEAHNIAGVAETLAFDPGGEASFQGNSYSLHTEAVGLTREAPGARGYRFVLTRNALRFEPNIAVNYFNYRGFDGGAAYTQPMSPNTIMSFGYLASRYDHSSAFNPATVSRTERGDVAYAQFDGQLGPRQPYSVRLGLERLAFAGVDAVAGDDFKGVIADAKLSAIVGGGTMFTVSFQRQPYRSFITANNYYVLNLLGGGVVKGFPTGTSMGADLAFSLNAYNQATSVGSATFYRQDRRVQVEAYANLALAKRVVFRVSLARYRRYSNAPGADYNNTVVFGGFVLGWT